jgi:glycosyltransferase involved in cell wall biosynthesis
MKPFFSIIVVVQKQPHLLAYTLDSILSQKNKDYEIDLIIDSIHDVRSVVKEYQKYLRYVHFTAEKGLSDMMNEGIMQAKGRYLQFICAGDNYMSSHDLFDMMNFIKYHDYPDFVFSPFIYRENTSSPSVEIRQFNEDYLKGGKIPSRLASSFFSIDILREMQGFDKRYDYRECFDLFCRLFTQSSCKFVFYPKVVVDYIVGKKTSQEAFQYYLETFLSIYRNFGLKEALFGWIRVNYYTMFKLWLKSLKKTT